MGVAYNIFVAAFAAIGSFLFGYDSGIIGEVISPTFLHFQSYFGNPSADLTGAIVSTFAGGCFFGAWAAGWLADHIGRKRTIMVGSLVACLGCALQTSAQNVAYLIAGRIIAGLAIGCLSMVVPLYQSEISPPHMRGFLTGMTQFMIAVGFLVAFWVGYGCQFLDSNAQWRVPLGIQIIPAALLFLGMFVLPYSPRWLIQKGRMEEAKHALQVLHGTDKNQDFIELEFAEMVEQIRYEQANFSHKVSDLWATRPMLRRTLTGIAVQVCTQLTGINVSSYFQPTLYKNLGYSGHTVLLLTGINGALGAVVLIFFITLVIDRVGRKPPLIIGSIGMAACLAIEAAINKNYGQGSDNTAAQKAGVAFIILFGSFFFSTSFGPISWIYQSEIFPMRVRAVGTSVCTMANWASSVLISQVSPIGLQNIGWKYYIVFVVTNVMNMLIVIFFFPETKGKSLEEMDAVFGDQVIPHALETGNTRNVDTEKGTHTPSEEKVAIEHREA
ncbi:general substrate transporter [Exidia glandulosa HHB12029]|uniref:General substrate transporter n=1 Tax=Exidia glandulosa HHB12029 TaxID=1314781 RepID=A0A165ZWW6_EXIGL|nr:general substrate transporter [Exidia glandulosa HHB12029]